MCTKRGQRSVIYGLSIIPSEINLDKDDTAGHAKNIHGLTSGHKRVRDNKYINMQKIIHAFLEIATTPDTFGPQFPENDRAVARRFTGTTCGDRRFSFCWLFSWRVFRAIKNPTDALSSGVEGRFGSIHVGLSVW